MIKVTEQDAGNSTVQPKCPHCQAEIQEIYKQRVSSTFGARYVYYCSMCRSVLGVSHRKGFWMG